MGCCVQSLINNDPTEAWITSKLEEAELQERITHKLLFLGPGGSGKSTIFKQLQWLHGGGFTAEDVTFLKQRIYSQITKQMKLAIKHYLSNEKSEEKSEQKFNKHMEDSINIVLKHENVLEFNNEVAQSVKYIWENAKQLRDIFTINYPYKNKNFLILDETTEYFWDSIDRINRSDYIPTAKDIMQVRHRTTGIIDKRFEIKSVKFHIFDVSGQKSERRKWVQCFDGVPTIVFVVSLSCYNEVMFEDYNRNCMVDSIELFDQIINNKYFKDTPIILFLNKMDLFKIKIRAVPITVCPIFGDYEEDATNYDATIDFIEKRFHGQDKQRNRSIHSHTTCALDDKNMETVFRDVVHFVIKKNLEGLNRGQRTEFL